MTAETEMTLAAILEKKDLASILVRTLGGFEVVRENISITSKQWGRDKTIQLFQFLITARQRHGLHKEQIIDRIWGNIDNGDQTFKVALHGVNKVLEPDRKKRSESLYIVRQGITYQLDTSDIWIDAEEMENLISFGNNILKDDPLLAVQAYQKAIDLYKGLYLPNRLYEDWSSAERERLQILALGAYIQLAELLIKTNPLETIRLCQEALLIDPTWEDAYRLQMMAYMEKGNRPMAIKTYKKCVEILDREFALIPLPETTSLYQQIIEIQ